jgi:glutaminyl-peptide cyclotransferase
MTGRRRASGRGREPERERRRAGLSWTSLAIAGGMAAAAVVLGYIQAGSDGHRAAGGSARGAQTPAATPARIAYDYRIVNVFPHDPGAFTQGLIYRDGYLFESTGLNGRSTLRKVRLEDGRVVQQHLVGQEHFAEGLTDWHDRLLQLTWQSNLGFVYDAETFAVERTFRYEGEGWGLAHDGRRLVMSDGSPRLRFLDPETLTPTGDLLVQDDGIPVPNLNELEVVKGEIFANVWQADYILTIDPSSGRVTGHVDLRGLLTVAERAGTDVLNGIAFDAERDRLFVTGKLWPKLFEIRLVRGSTP